MHLLLATFVTGTLAIISKIC